MSLPPKPLPSTEFLNSILRYDPETGFIYWRERGIETFPPHPAIGDVWVACWNAKNAGNRAFSNLGKSGYLRGKVNGSLFTAHRIAWAMAGRSAAPMLDHINGNRSDNRLENLRRSSPPHNNSNRKPVKGNSSGVRGVMLLPNGRWRAHLKINGVQVLAKSFLDVQDAIACRLLSDRAFGIPDPLRSTT